MEDEIWRLLTEAAALLTAEATSLLKQGNGTRAGAYAERSETILMLAKRTREGN